MTQQLPEWNNPGVEPPQSLKDSGWAAGVKPSAQHFNWLLNRNFEVMKELQEIGSQATIDFKTDYNYQLGNVVGRQLRLTRISDVTRIPFLLEAELPEGAAITVSIDGGNTSLPLRDIDGNDVTAIPKGFGEVVASGDFFTLVNKGGSLTQDQLQALIDIVNEMTANDNDLRQSFISSVIATDPNIPLNTNSTWNQILTQIPNINSSRKRFASGSVISSANGIDFTRYDGQISSRSYITVDGLTFKPSLIFVFSDGIYGCVYAEDFIYNGNELSVNFTNAGAITIRAQTSPSYVNETGFLLAVSRANSNYTWYAFG